MALQLWFTTVDQLYKCGGGQRLLWCTMLVVFLSGSVRSADVTLTGCGDGSWYKGQEITLTCTVLKTNYPSKCVSASAGNGQVHYRLESNPRCIIRNVTTTCSSGNVSTGQCGCIKEDEGQYVFAYRFSATLEDQGRWDCDVPCFDGPNQVLTYQGADCLNVSVTDPCAAGPCVNGTCHTISMKEFSCTCDDGFRGQTCNETDPCAAGPCVNGTCHTISMKEFSCTCDDGFRGQTCNETVPGAVSGENSSTVVTHVFFVIFVTFAVSLAVPLVF